MSNVPNSPRDPQDRPPRFVLKAHEQQALAFTRGGDRPECMAQNVMDFSAGGVAFVCNVSERPEVGETLQIEMKILNNVHTMRRKGRVLRSEVMMNEDGTVFARVGIQFLEEPLAKATLVPGAAVQTPLWVSPQMAYAFFGLLALVMILLFIFV